MSRVGIVTVTYNSSEVLEDFLESVRSTVGVEVVLYVVDNASSDDSLEVVRAWKKWSGVTTSVIANDQNLGIAAGNNQGARLALEEGVDFILFANNDIFFGVEAISELVSLASTRKLDLVTPLILGTEPPDRVWYQGGSISRLKAMQAVHENLGQRYDQRGDHLSRTGYASTCFLLVRPNVMRRVGGMDESFFVYFDDVDFILRCQSAGFAVWVSADTVITHKVSSLTGGATSNFSLHWMSRNWLLINRRHRSMAGQVWALIYVLAWTAGRVVTRRDPLVATRKRIRGYMGVLSASPPVIPDLDSTTPRF